MNYIRCFLKNYFPHRYTEGTRKEKTLGASNKTLSIIVRNIYLQILRSNMSMVFFQDLIGIVVTPLVWMIWIWASLTSNHMNRDHSLLPTINRHTTIASMAIWGIFGFI